MESRIQNKVAAIALIVGAYIGLLALYHSSTNQNDWVNIISLFIIVIGLIPIFFFLLYILFLPLRYKQRDKNKFSLDVHEYYVEEANVDRLFDIGADLLVPIFIGGFSYFGIIKLINTFIGNNPFAGFAVAILGYVIPVNFVKYLIQAERIDKDYYLGAGFASLIKRIISNIRHNKYRIGKTK